MATTMIARTTATGPTSNPTEPRTLAASTSDPAATTANARTAATTRVPPIEPGAGPAIPHYSGTLVVKPTRVLGLGEYVASNRMRLAMQSDGNLVVLDEGGTARWSSRTAGSGHHVVFQNDGNLVVYSADNRALWSSGTAGYAGAELVLQNDGNLMILADGAAVWAVDTAH
ncbi:hypothetical protein [Streptomyces sp. NPDC056707]|uniref:hypothetical protein n=1 Tax=Streptomyces sp. NPDC056707 TaxID=3345919 RepID=UPI0036C3B00D